MSNKTLNLDISKEPKINPIIYGRVGDGDSQRITVNTSKRDEQLDLTGYTITFEGVTSGGKTKVFDSDNVVSTSDGLKKGTFDYVFPNMAFAVTGKYERAYFSFIKNDIRDTSGEIEIIVLDNADIDAPEAETIITEYNKLVAELRKLQDEAISEMNDNFANTEAHIAELEAQISNTQTEIDQALEAFQNGNFWKKEESFNKEQSSANAANHVENLATQAEAEAGASDSKSMSPLRSKQQIDKRVATDTEILAGTDKTKLVTPYSSKLFYDSQEKNRSKFLSVRTKYAAHRGNNSVFPENSLEAFKSVTRHEFFECDVQVTKDDEWIVMHDTTVDRTTNGTGNVKDLTYAQIRALKIDAGSNINNLQDWQKVVPDLSDVCQCARYGKSIPMIEIKGGAGEVYSDAQLDKFMDTLHQFRMLPDGAIVISFDADILARIRQRSNEIELMWIQNSIPLNGLDICKANRFGIDVAYNSATLTKENITAFHKAGLLVGTWTTPEENHQQQEGLGVDIITTNSKSGFLRYGSLTLKNGFTGNTNNGLQNYNVVEEISPGQVRAYFNVLNGVNTSDSLVATFPDWAVPFANSWQFCNIRTSSGSILATANVMGKTSENAGIWIGLNWTQRTTWAAGVLHWSLY